MRTISRKSASALRRSRKAYASCKTKDQSTPATDSKSVTSLLLSLSLTSSTPPSNSRPNSAASPPADHSAPPTPLVFRLPDLPAEIDHIGALIATGCITAFVFSIALSSSRLLARVPLESTLTHIAISPKLRRLRLPVRASMNARRQPQHVHRRTTFCRWGSALLLGSHKAHRRAIRPGRGARGLVLGPRRILQSSTHLEPALYLSFLMCKLPDFVRPATFPLAPGFVR
jgi:hypothetical protein